MNKSINNNAPISIIQTSSQRLAICRLIRNSAKAALNRHLKGAKVEELEDDAVYHDLRAKKLEAEGNYNTALGVFQNVNSVPPL